MGQNRVSMKAEPLFLVQITLPRGAALWKKVDAVIDRHNRYYKGSSMGSDGVGIEAVVDAKGKRKLEALIAKVNGKSPRPE